MGCLPGGASPLSVSSVVEANDEGRVVDPFVAHVRSLCPRYTVTRLPTNLAACANTPLYGFSNALAVLTPRRSSYALVMTQMEEEGADRPPPRDPTRQEKEPADEEMEEEGGSEGGSEDALSDSGTDLSDIGVTREIPLHTRTCISAGAEHGSRTATTATLPEAPATVGAGAITGRQGVRRHRSLAAWQFRRSQGIATTRTRRCLDGRRKAGAGEQVAGHRERGGCTICSQSFRASSRMLSSNSTLPWSGFGTCCRLTPRPLSSQIEEAQENIEEEALVELAGEIRKELNGQLRPSTKSVSALEAEVKAEVEAYEQMWQDKLVRKEDERTIIVERLEEAGVDVLALYKELEPQTAAVTSPPRK